MLEKITEELPLIIFFAVMCIAWWLLRSKATNFDSVKSFDNRIGNGRPLVLEFFSNG